MIIANQIYCYLFQFTSFFSKRISQFENLNNPYISSKFLLFSHNFKTVTEMNVKVRLCGPEGNYVGVLTEYEKQ